MRTKEATFNRNQAATIRDRVWGRRIRKAKNKPLSWREKILLRDSEHDATVSVEWNFKLGKLEIIRADKAKS
jgi:hypothetical protein